METISEGVEFRLFKAFCHEVFFCHKIPELVWNIKSPGVSGQCLKTWNSLQMEVFGKAGLRLLNIRKRLICVRVQALLGMSCLS